MFWTPENNTKLDKLLNTHGHKYKKIAEIMGTRKDVIKRKVQQVERVGAKCEWCGQAFPTAKYHLLICPDCRRSSVSTFMKSVRK